MAMPYYIELTDKLWLKDNLAPYGVNVYFVQKIAGFTPSGTAIFNFFDDFATFDTNVWYIFHGSASVSGSALLLGNTTLNSVVHSYASFDVNTVCEMRMYSPSANASICGYWSQPSSQVCWLGANGANLNNHTYLNNGTTTSATDDGVNRSGATYYKYGIAYLASGAKYYVNDVYRRTNTTGLPTGPLNLGFYSTLNKGNVSVDYVRIRQYADLDPTVTVQAVTGGYNVIVKNNTNVEYKNFQFSIPAASLGTLTATTSLCVDPLHRTPLKKPFSKLFDKCVLNVPDCTRDITSEHSVSFTNTSKVVDRLNCSNNATAFDGSSTRGVVTHAADLDFFNYDASTYVCWIRQIGDYSGLSCCVLSKGINEGYNRWNFHIVSNETGFFAADADSTYQAAGQSPPIVITDGLWHMIGFAKSGSNVLVYKDGVFVKTHAMTGITNFANTNALNIGCRYIGSYDRFFNGEQGEFAIYNGVTWTAAQMKKYYDLTKAGYVNPVVHGGQF